MKMFVYFLQSEVLKTICSIFFYIIIRVTLRVVSTVEFIFLCCVLNYEALEEVIQNTDPLPFFIPVGERSLDTKVLMAIKMLSKK